MMHRGSTSRRRDDSGAVAVEGALVICFILIPLMLGVLYYGMYLWKAQRVSTLEFSGIPAESVSGTYTCLQLIDRVRTLLGNNVTSLGGQLGIDPSLIGVSVDVINVLPTIGVDIRLRFDIPILNDLGDLLPLPNNGLLIEDVTQRLENVQVSTTSC